MFEFFNLKIECQEDENHFILKICPNANEAFGSSMNDRLISDCCVIDAMTL